jgi:hypothetical protein
MKTYNAMLTDHRGQDTFCGHQHKSPSLAFKCGKEKVVTVTVMDSDCNVARDPNFEPSPLLVAVRDLMEARANQMLTNAEWEALSDCVFDELGEFIKWETPDELA